MNHLAIIMVLSSSILHALRDFLIKKSVDKQIFIWWISLLSTLMTLPAVIYLWVVEGPPTPFGVLISLSVGIVHYFYWVFYSKAYEEGDLSHVYPIIRSAPVFVFFIAVIFLNEKISELGVAGIITVTLGVYLINLKSWDKKSLLGPLANIKKERSIRFAFLALLTVTAYSILDKIGVSYINPILYAFFLSVSALIPFTIGIFRNKSKGEASKQLKNQKYSIAAATLAALINYPLILIVYTFTPVSYVVSLRQTSVIFAVLLGGQLLKEQYRLIRFLAASIIFSGSVMIAIA